MQLFLKFPLGARTPEAVQHEGTAQRGPDIPAAHLLLRHGGRCPWSSWRHAPRAAREDDQRRGHIPDGIQPDDRQRAGHAPRHSLFAEFPFKSPFAESAIRQAFKNRWPNCMCQRPKSRSQCGQDECADTATLRGRLQVRETCPVRQEECAACRRRVLADIPQQGCRRAADPVPVSGSRTTPHRTLMWR